jgi:oligopeptide transport system substrate-binding protein
MNVGRTVAATLAVVLAFVSSLPRPAAGAERVIRLAISQEPPQLDSTRGTDSVSAFVVGHVKEGLTRYGKNGEIVPGVARSWRVEARRATFRLREEARWADGKPVTARDFVFAWRTAVDPRTASEYAFILYPIKNAEAVNRGRLPPAALGVSARDDHTLEIELEKPCGYFLGLTAFTTYLPVREDFYASRPGRYAADASDLLSNGPFVLTRWVHGAALTLEKNPLYWDAGRIRIDRIEIPYITSDANARFNLFKDGKVDVLETIGRDELELAQAERFRMKSFADGSLYFMEFNHREGRPTASWNLRKAIQLAFQPKEYVSRVVGIPGSRPGLSLIPQWMPGRERAFRKEYPLEPARPDLAAARRHLEAAKAELGGTIPPLVWLTGDTPGAAREAEYFQRVLATRLGIELRIDKQIFKQRLAKMTAGQFDIVSAGWRPDYADPMTYADLLASWNENNRGRYRSARFDALIRRAQATADPKERMDAMAAAERIAFDDVAVLPLYERTLIYVHSRRVDGIVRHQIGPDPDYTFATVEPGERARAWSSTR